MPSLGPGQQLLEQLCWAAGRAVSRGHEPGLCVAGSKAEGLGCVALRYEAVAHRSAHQVDVLVVLEGRYAERGSTLPERRAARGQMVLLEPVGRSQARLSYC